MYEMKSFFSEIRFKIIRDPIYGFIEVPEDILDVLDNMFIQRLRWISQLPLEQLVYPSAQHSRFEHSLGTMYLAGVVMMSLLYDDFCKKKLKKLWREMFNTRRYKKNVLLKAISLVGLLHDVGHMPFSHTMEDAFSYFEDKFNDWNIKRDIPIHEQVGYYISNYVLNASNVSEDVKKIVLLTLNKEKDPPNGLIKLFRQIIDNVIDVDKGDYLLRDSYHCGVKYGLYDKDRLWRYVTLDDEGNLAYYDKAVVDAMDILMSRFKMYRNVYKHHVRNNVDAIVTKIIIGVINDLIENKQEEKIYELFPFLNVLRQGTSVSEETLVNLALWTDSSFLKSIEDIDNTKGKIERFLKRKLVKQLVKKEIDSVKDIFHIRKKALKYIVEDREVYINIRKEYVFPFSSNIGFKVTICSINKRGERVYKTLNEYMNLKGEKKIKEYDIIMEIYSGDKTLDGEEIYDKICKDLN